METDDAPKKPVSEQEEDPEAIFPNLMSLPEEVLQGCILPHLDYNELLRLRRVSQPIKLLSERILRKNVLSVVREINGSNFTFENYLHVDLPTTSIYLNNSSSSSAIFEDPSLSAFLHVHGPQITHLKVELFSCCVSEQELHFYSSLPNLKALEIQLIEVPPADEEIPPRFPPNFKDLKTLKLNDIQGPSREACQDYAWNLIQFCENLEYLKGSRISIEQIMNYIWRRHALHPELANLRFYDMKHFLALTGGEDDDPFGDLPRFMWDPRPFAGLAQLCLDNGVKLLNVHSNLIQTYCPNPLWLQWLGATFEAFTTPMVSLLNVGEATNCVELPYLEKLTIRSTYWSRFKAWPRERGRLGHGEEWRITPRWPKLEQVDLTIDGLVGWREHDTFPNEEATLRLFNFLFDCGRQADGIRDLAIRYAEEYRQWQGDRQVREFPWVRKLTSTCPLLTKFTLVNWKGAGEEMVGFWEGFPFLEEIVLEACELIGDEAFVGGDKAFLNLKNLKKLSLRRLDLMPQITDWAFESVFQNLDIKQFILTGRQPLKSITAVGIESLIDGQFNRSVERFPFDGWSLDGVMEEAFNELKMKFRATHMI